MTETLITKELDGFLRGLEKLFTPDEAAELVYAAARYAGEEAVSYLQSIYPPDPPPRPTPEGKSPIRTEKQHRWFWATMSKLARGEGDVPESLRGWKASYRRISGRKTLVIDPDSGYVRTGTLVRSLTYEIEPDGMSVNVIVGPSMARGSGARGIADYAGYVIGDPQSEQAAIHQGRWTPLAQGVAEDRDNIIAAFEDALRSLVAERVRGGGGKQVPIGL